MPAKGVPESRFRARMAMRAKRMSAAAVVVSVVCGVALLRFLRTRDTARTSEATARAQMLAERQGGPERASPDSHSLRILFSRIEDNFATGYQTMTAIIQGVALVVLVTTAAHAVFGGAPGSQVATAASQAVTVFVIIIVTTDQFFQLATATRWLPTTFDTAIPYLVGAGEAVAALSLGDDTRWWGGIAWSFLAGTIAFWHSAVRATPKGFEGIEDYYRHFVRDVRRSRLICAGLCAYAVALSVTSALAHLSPWLYIAAPWVVTATVSLRVVQVARVRWGGVPTRTTID
jgi:hypothetical protein